MPRGVGDACRRRTPCTKWSYSNYGYNLLGRVVALAGGQDLSTAVQQCIARPLGLHRTLLTTSATASPSPSPTGTGWAMWAPRRPPPLPMMRQPFRRRACERTGHGLHARGHATLVPRPGDR
ncbi:serine hydrolase [Streptomyces sp. NPDC058398]|uniref:serine hydrolase n=1 Tax=Streptomyces sp. NPDC058398 TaxID=3346479 RepID=UPI003666266E